MTQETETITGPERIWLLDYPDVSATWCQDPDPDGEHSDSIEYVRADLSTNKDETIAKLRKALKPFAEQYADYDVPDANIYPDDSSLPELNDLRIGDLRRAADALTSTKKEG